MSTGCWGVKSSVTKPTREVDRLGSTVARLKLKGIDGDPHKRWMMWINSMQREKPYLALTCREGDVNVSVPEREHSDETAGDKPEEGGDDVKSSWPLWLGPHTSYNGRNRGQRSREAKPIPENRS